MSSEESDAPVPWARKGPHGYGHPDDMRLRKIEKDVLIKNKVRAVARERCKDEISEFHKCAGLSGLKMAFVCRRENEAMISCLSKWFYDPELNEKMKIEYLNERNEFRRTGIKKNRVSSNVK